MISHATLTFATRTLAEEFAKLYSRRTLKGHDISAGKTNVTVTVYNVTDEDKNWIDSFVEQVNDQ